MAPMETTTTNAPFWGNITSTLDWCEQNYEVLPQIAEFYNTVSNLALIIPALQGMIDCKRLRLPLRFWLAYASLLLVGVGSWMFHMTLRWEYQLLDELPMIYCASVMLYCIPKQSVLDTWKGAALAAFGALYAAVVTYLYLKSKEAVFFQVSYGTMIVFIMILAAIRGVMANRKQLLSTGFVCFVTAFTLWLCDNNFCYILEKWRAQLGPCAPLLQLHAWWHIGVAIGGYCYVFFLTMMYLIQDGGLKPHQEPRLVFFHSLVPRVEVVDLEAGGKDYNETKKGV